MKLFRNKLWLGLILSVIGVASFLAFKNKCHLRSEEYRTYLSPDRRFNVVVQRFPMKFAFPGQSGDAPGRVQLCDASGKVLREKEIEMVQLADNVSWSDTNVEIRLFVDWKLPK